MLTLGFCCVGVRGRTGRVGLITVKKIEGIVFNG